MTRSPARKRPYFLAAAFVVVVLLVYLRWMPTAVDETGHTDTSPVMSGQEIGNVPAGEATPALPGRLPGSIAVLPVETATGSPAELQLAAGIHAQLVGRLEQLNNLTVIARRVYLQPWYLARTGSLDSVAARLDVESVMQCILDFDESGLHLSAELYNAGTGDLLWSGAFTGELPDLDRFYAETAAQVSAALLPGRDTVPRPGGRAHPPARAYDLYLRARGMGQELDPFARPEFYELLDQALALDAAFTDALALQAAGYAAALTHGIQVKGMTFSAMERISLEQIQDVTLLDPDNELAYAAQAYIHWHHQRGAPAQQAFVKALELAPGNVEIMLAYATLLTVTGQHQAAAATAGRAAVLAPGDPQVTRLQAISLMYADNTRQALQLLEQLPVGAVRSYDDLLLLAQLRFIGGDRQGAVLALREADRWLQDSVPYFESIAMHVHAYAMLGMPAEAMRVFEYLDHRIESDEYISAGAQALAYLAIGYTDIAFDVLYRSPNEGMGALMYIRVNPLRDPVLESSRFAELRGRIRLISGTANVVVPPF